MIILLSGADSFRISQKLNKYKEKFLRDIDSTGVNIETLEGAEVTIESFRKAVLSGGLFVKKRLVIIKNLFNSQDKKLFTEIEKTAGSIVLPKGCCGAKMQDTILIFIQTETHQQKNSKLYKLLAKQKFSENFEPLVGVKLNNWIKKTVGDKGGKISPQAIQYLTVNIGPDLWQMSNEIDKLVNYKSGAEIAFEDCQQFIKTKLDENIFNLTDAFGRKNKGLVLKLLNDQIQAGSAWPYLLTMLARQIKIILQIKTALEYSIPQYQLARTLKLKPYVIQKTMPQTRFFSIDELKKIHSRLLQIDLKLKTSQTDPEVLFDLLVAS